MAALKAIALIVSVIMPADRPDINHVERVKSFEACWSMAREFAEKDLSAALRDRGALGLKATCGYYEMPSEDEDRNP